MEKIRVLAALAAAAGVLLTGCDDSSESGKPNRLSTPEIVVSDVATDSFRASWDAVEHAAGYACVLSSVTDGTEHIVAEEPAYAGTEKLFENLAPSTAYRVKVVALAAEGSGFADSEPGHAEAVTAKAPEVPWVEVEIACELLNDKQTFHIVNKPNGACVHIYSSTENVNVIGGGYDDEETLTGYLLEDYENHVPGVYGDVTEHHFNNNGAGFAPGGKMFYYVVGEDAAGRVGRLNWFWLEMPANAGDAVIILDSAEGV